MTRVVITYGTFDWFHYGHLMLLQRLKALGDKLVVGVSTDAFNAVKGKRTIIPFDHRIALVGAVRHVDACFAEDNWAQKPDDIRRFGATVFAMGQDWEGKFDALKAHCEVVYLPRTDNISSTDIKYTLNSQLVDELSRISSAVDSLQTIVKALR